MKYILCMKTQTKSNNQTTFFYNPTKRLLAVFLLIAFLFVAIFIKLIFVMVVQSDSLQKKAISQWMRDVPTDAYRGDIVDANGNLLASTSTRYNVFVRPNFVKNKQLTSKVVAQVFSMDEKKVYEKISKSASEVTIYRGATKEQLNSLYTSNLQGIYYSEDSLRYYPYGDFMTQILGFTDFDGNGQTGLESYYNKYLSGVDGAVLTETDLIGREINNGVKHYLPSVQGMKMVTTLDAKIQQIADMAVEKAVLKFNPKGVSCTIMNYTDGSIIAMSEYPSFDLNNVPRDDLEKLFLTSKSKVISTVFEPGSTFKILTAAAALDAGVVTPEDRFFCAGSRMVDGQKIKCWKSKGHGSINFAQGVEQSCNCVFMDCAARLGTERFYSYLNKFGLSSRSGVDMTGETSGIFISEKNVKTVDLARIGFGQAVAVTPIGLLRATSSVVNGGNLVTPHLLNYFQSSCDGKQIENPNLKVYGGTIKAETSEIMRKLLLSVVTNGSGKGAYNAGYNILGKTGTAQKYIDGHIAQGKYVSSFLGYSLEAGATYGILLSVDEPQGYMYYGSLVAAPLVGEIFKNIFEYKAVAPHFSGKEQLIIGEPFMLESYVGENVLQAKNKLNKLGLHVEISGEGDNVIGQFPEKGTVVDKRNAVLLIT